MRLSRTIFFVAAFSAALFSQSLPPQITPDVSGFTAYVGDPVSIQLACANCPGLAGWQISAGSLPSGLTLNSLSGLISGNPTTVQNLSFTVQALANSLNPVLSRSYTFQTVQHLTINTNALPNGQIGLPYAANVNVSGGYLPYFWQVAQGSLPTGLALDPYTGNFTGVPTALGTSTFVVAVGDSTESSARATYSITINPPGVSITTTALPNTSAGSSYTATLAATGGNPPYLWSVASGQLPPGLRLSSTGAITGVTASTASGSYTFVAQVNDTVIPGAYAGSSATRSFTIAVNPGALTITTTSLPNFIPGVPYSVGLSAAGGIPPYNWSLTGGQLPAGLSLSNGGAITGLPTSGSAGNYTITVQVRDTPPTGTYQGSVATRTFTLGYVPGQLTITTGPALPAATIGQPYSVSLGVSGGNPAYVWTLDSGQLPLGLTFSGGVISGIPVNGANTTFTFTAHVTDTPAPGVYLGGTASRTFTLPVLPAALTISTATLPSGSVGTPYSVAVGLNGGTAPYTWTISEGALPDGLTLSSTGVFSGTPTAPGTSNFTLTVQDAHGQSAAQALSLTITPALSITTATLADAVVAIPYASFIAASGGTAPYSFSIASGTLPPGVTLASNGALTGTPTTAGTYTFTAAVSDGLKASVSKTYTLVVHPALRITTTSLPAGTRNVSYSTSIAVDGGAPPYSFRASSGSLPPGLTLSSDGTLSGTPTASGTFSLAVHASDSAGAFADATLNLRITDAPSITTTSLQNGFVGVNYFATLDGQGVTPISWSIASGSLPAGLSLNAATGAITGVPASAGTSTFTVRVTDNNQPSLNSTRLLSLTIQTPALPDVNITQVPNSVASGVQPTFGILLSQGYPTDLTGNATLTFQPVSGSGDPSILFANGKTTMSFTVPAGQVIAIPPAATPFAFQTGTVAGTITISAALSANGQVLTPNPAVTQTITIPKAAPVITNVQLNSTATGLNVVVTGYSNTREISAATFTFTTVGGSTLSTSQFNVPVASTFQTWYVSDASAPYGGQFQLTVPFTVSQGAVAGIASVQVTLTNSIGSTIGTGGF